MLLGFLPHAPKRYFVFACAGVCTCVCTYIHTFLSLSLLQSNWESDYGGFQKRGIEQEVKTFPTHLCQPTRPAILYLSFPWTEKGNKPPNIIKKFEENKVWKVLDSLSCIFPGHHSAMQIRTLSCGSLKGLAKPYMAWLNYRPHVEDVYLSGQIKW